MRTSTLTLLLLSIATGCLPAPAGPKPGAIPTGERLAAVDDVKTWTTTYQEKTGTIEHKDGDGNVIGSSDHYRDRTQLHAMKIWYPVQGRHQINDEDFFKFTDDKSSLEATVKMHSKGRTYQVLGTTGMLIGIGGMIAARFVPTPGGSLQIGLYSGGAILGCAGAYGYYRGWEMLSPDSHAVDQSIAIENARRYNRTLGRGASISILQRRF